MARKTLRVGIMPKEEFRKRTIAIAKGECTPKANEPKVWFESLQSLAQVLSLENQELLYLILEKKPQSLKELGDITGRKSSNLSRTLHTMERYGIVELLRTKSGLCPKVKAANFKLETGIDSPWFADWALRRDDARV